MNLSKIAYLLFILVTGSFSLEAISVVPAIKGQYEAEQYLASQYLVTNLHLSEKPGKRPLILMLGGSNEGFTYEPGDWRINAFLERGFHVLEAEYFLKPKVLALPDKLSQIRLESFWEEIEEYLKSDKLSPLIDQDLIGVMGTSKGGELALLLSSIYPQFKYVIGVVPSHVVFQGSNTTLFHYSSWTYQGQEVPFVPFPNFSIATIWGVLTRIFCSLDNVNFTWMHNRALKNKKAVEKAIIKVENINGPVLLISGERDQWWPSAEMSRRIMARLQDNRFFHPYVHFECDTDHFPFYRKPEAWGAMMDQVEKMVEYRRNLSAKIK